MNKNELQLNSQLENDTTDGNGGSICFEIQKDLKSFIYANWYQGREKEV